MYISAQTACETAQILQHWKLGGNNQGLFWKGGGAFAPRGLIFTPPWQLASPILNTLYVVAPVEICHYAPSWHNLEMTRRQGSATLELNLDGVWPKLNCAMLVITVIPTFAYLPIPQQT